MIDKVTLVIGASLLILVMANAAIANALFIERKKAKKSWLNILESFSLRTDLIPLLLVTFQDYRKLDKASFSAVIKQKNICYANHTLGKKISDEKKLDHFIDQIVTEAEKIPKLRTDIDFLEIRNLIEERRNIVRAAIIERESAVSTYNNRLNSWYSFLVRSILRFKKISGVPKY